MPATLWPSVAGLRRIRLTSYACLLVVVGAVAYPCWWRYGQDSFPLSNYPMFARPRAQRVRMPTVVGITHGGERVTLSPELIGGARWINMSARLVRRTIRKGRDASAALCEAVAHRVIAAQRTDLAAVEVVTEVFDSVAYMTSGAGPSKRRVHARCEVSS